MNKQADAIRFTVEERILLHLLSYTTYRTKIEVPPTITQEGISQIIHIHRKHLPRSLNTMKEKNLVLEKTSHVKGKSQRMKTYYLTLNGEAKAQELRDNITNLTINIRDKNGKIKKTTIRNVQHFFKGLKSLAEILSCINTDGAIDLSQTLEKSEENESLPDRLNIYKKALEQAWKDGKMTKNERDILMNLRNSLNISEGEHIQIEEKILANIENITSSEAQEVYRIALKQALADHRISADERAMLEKIKRHFKITDI